MTYDFNSLIGQIKLSSGYHLNADEGMCAMEFVSWLEGEPFSDSPDCTCPVIAEFVRNANDKMKQEDRDKLLLILPRLVGTVSPEHEIERAEYFAWQAIKVFAPRELRACGLVDHAKKLEGCADLIDAARAADAADAVAYEAACEAYAARRAASAAYAAADAANSAYAAAHSAAYAAHSAAYAEADAACADFYQMVIDALEGALAIGPQSPGFSQSEDHVRSVIEQARKTCPAQEAIA